MGNYFGMIRPAMALQVQGRTFYFVADLHALTTVRDRALLAQHVRDVALGLSSDALRKRIMQIVADSAAIADPKDPSHSTIVALYRLVASPAEVERSRPWRGCVAPLDWTESHGG